MPRQNSEPRELVLATHTPADPHDIFLQCTSGWAGVKANAMLIAVVPAMLVQDMDGRLANLDTALKAAPGGTAAQKKAPRSAARKVTDSWTQVALCVQGALRKVPAEDVPPILASVLMYVSNGGKRPPKRPLAAVPGDTSGSVRLLALAIAGTLVYDWEWSLDQLSWSTTRTGEAEVTLSGLTPGKVYYFRVRAFLRGNTTSDYVQTISLMVT